MQNARRTSLQNYEIDGSDGTLQSQIAMHQRPWPAAGAPLSPMFENAGFSDFPRITVDGVGYEAHRDLLTPDSFASFYAIYLLASADSTEKIIESAPENNNIRVTRIQFQGESFVLKSCSVFGFKFELTQNEFCLARFKDVSPFLTFSAKRQYAIESGEREIAPLLLAFSFFLAVCSAYK